MTSNQPPASDGPTVILIGGPMTVDDGSTLDSRQPIEGDAASKVTRESLATSWLWWTTASSLAGLLLDSEKSSRFALMIGTRTVVELQPDGALRRIRLRSLMSGGTGTVELVRTHRAQPLPDGFAEAAALTSWSGEAAGIVGFKRGEPGRWGFLDGDDYYLGYAGPLLGAGVIVDTSDSITGDDDLGPDQYRALERQRLYDDRMILLMPHTHRSEEFLRGYVGWVQAGRPRGRRSRPVWTSRWDPAAPPNPLRYTCPVPVSADFKVTGLVQAGTWRDPADLEAARSLLQARYDVKIGFWDLVRNPTLRNTLLNSTPTTAAPPAVAPIPVGAAQRAGRRVEETVQTRSKTAAALAVVTERLTPLHDAGWEHVRPDAFRLPLTEPLHLWPDDDAFPLVSLNLRISKRQTKVDVFTTMYRDLDITQYVLTHQTIFENIAAPDECPLDTGSWPILWRAPGGWDDEVDWERRAQALARRTPEWIHAFDSFRQDCLRIQPEALQRHQSRRRQNSPWR